MLALPGSCFQALAFSQDGSLLASLSRSQEGSASLALWLVDEAEAAELVAGVELPGGVTGLAWEAPVPGGLPTFYTASSQGLTQWQLDSECLASTPVHVPAAMRGVPLTAVATCRGLAGKGVGQSAASGGTSPAAAAGSSHGHAAASASLTMVYAGDASGRVWQLEVDCGQDVRQARLLAEVPGQAISCLCAPPAECGSAPSLLAVGTTAGSLLLLARVAVEGSETGWSILAGEQLDGAVSHLHVDAGCKGVTAATACGTLRRLGPDSTAPRPPRVLLCGQQQRLCSWQLAPGAVWKRVPPTVALASAAGVAVWQLVSPARPVLPRA